jgi:hypothetical protein
MVASLDPQLAVMLEYNRTSIANGEIWRLVTGSIVHWTTDHLFWDLLMFVVLGAAIERRGHVMFMHNRDVHIANAGFYKLGRTDKSKPINDSVVDANVTLTQLIAAITSAGGPTYDWRQINPVDDQDGGQPGGNIRVGFLFRTDRGVAFVDRPGGSSTTPTSVVNGASGPQLSASPGRISPSNTAWNASRKPLVGEFTYRDETVFVIANHFNSKGGDDPLFGRFQPPTRISEVQRHHQAQVVNDFVDSILTVDGAANIIVLGDINDFDFSDTVSILKGGVLHNLMDTLPQAERYSYVFEGNSQVLDQILVSRHLYRDLTAYDVVHVNSEFAVQASDHEPQVARFVLKP